MVLNGEWPLTGEKLEGDLPDHPVYVAKIEKRPRPAPQIGLASADMVVEELVEGGLTRLAVFYYSDIPDEVGPVRSMRASDVGIVKPVNGELVASGAAPRHHRRAADARRHRSTPRERPGMTGTPADRPRTTCSSTSTSSPTSRARSGRRRSRPYLTFGDADEFQRQHQGQVRRRAASPAAHTTNWVVRQGRLDAHRRLSPTTTSSPTTCCCCGSRSATPATSTRPATRFLRPYFYGKGQGVLVHGDSAHEGEVDQEGQGRRGRADHRQLVSRCRCRAVTPGSSCCRPTTGGVRLGK